MPVSLKPAVKGMLKLLSCVAFSMIVTAASAVVVGALLPLSERYNNFLQSLHITKATPVILAADLTYFAFFLLYKKLYGVKDYIPKSLVPGIDSKRAHLFAAAIVLCMILFNVSVSVTMRVQNPNAGVTLQNPLEFIFCLLSMCALGVFFEEIFFRKIVITEL